MNKSAVFHRATIEYCYAADCDTVVVNIRTGKDVEKAALVYGDPFFNELRGEREWTGKKTHMKLLCELEQHLLWTVRLKPKYKRLKYYFELFSNGETYAVYENKICPVNNVPGTAVQCFKYAWLNPSDVITPPRWVEDTVWYQIMPDRFCRASDSPKDKRFKDWGDMESPSWNDIYGGNLRGITERLGYIKSLGISGIYMTPIFKSGSNHKYNTYDYWQVDPDFGTEDDLKELIDTAHSMGIRVMLDAVFNHCGHEFFAWRDVFEKGRKSKYYDWFFINTEDFAKYEFSTEDARYYSFSFWAGMPKLNTNNPEVVDYFTRLCEHWVKDWGIDGIRFDVGDEVSHTFIRSLNASLKAINPDVFLLGEIWTDSISWLGGKEYDSVMNYPLPDAVNDFWRSKDRRFSDLIFSLNYCRTLYPEQITRVLFNFLDTHDTPRAAEICENDGALLQKLAVLLSLPGTPCLYYGTEIAMKGRDTPYNRQCMPWDEIDRGGCDGIKSGVERLIRLRNAYPELRSGELEFLPDEKLPRLVRLVKGGSVELVLNAGEESVSVSPNGKILFEKNYESGELKPDGIILFQK